MLLQTNFLCAVSLKFQDFILLHIAVHFTLLVTHQIHTINYLHFTDNRQRDVKQFTHSYSL